MLDVHAPVESPDVHICQAESQDESFDTFWHLELFGDRLLQAKLRVETHLSQFWKVDNHSLSVASWLLRAVLIDLIIQMEDQRL